MSSWVPEAVVVAAVASLAAKIWRPPADTGTSPKIETMSMEWCSTYPKGGVDTKAAAAALVDVVGPAAQPASVIERPSGPLEPRASASSPAGVEPDRSGQRR